MAQQEGLVLEPSVPVKNPVAPDVEPPQNTNGTEPYVIPDTPDRHSHHPTATEDPTLPPSATPDEHSHHPAVTEGLTPLPPAIPGERGDHPAVTEDPTPLPPATHERDHHPAVGPSAPAQDSPFSRWSGALLEMKQQIEQFAEGRIQRMSNLNQVCNPSQSLKRRRLTQSYLIPPR